MNDKVCGFCFNSAVCDDLNSDNDFSYMSVGTIAGNRNIYIRSGADYPTSIIIDELFSDNQYHNVGLYVMKYCPECGRRLHENDYFFEGDSDE